MQFLICHLPLLPLYLLRSGGGSRAQWAHATTQTHHPQQAHDQAQNPTAFNTFNGQLRSPMDNAMTSNTTAVNINHQEVQASAASNYQAFGINSILHQQEQDVFPEITFSPPRECCDQYRKTKYAYQQEQHEHPDVLTRYRCTTQHRRVGNYFMVWSSDSQHSFNNCRIKHHFGLWKLCCRACVNMALNCSHFKAKEDFCTLTILLLPPVHYNCL